MKKKVIIVGGGFGGVYTTKNLLRFGFEVILINDHNYFTFSPLLHEVATGGLDVPDIIFEYESFFRSDNFSFIRGRARDVNFENKSVLVDDLSLQADFLVIATGSKTRKRGIEGAQYAIELKTIDDAKHIKKNIIELVQGTKRDITISVIGAGPTGVELVLEIGQFINRLNDLISNVSCKLRLINNTETILGNFSTKIQNYALDTLKKSGVEVCNSTNVVSIHSDYIVINNNRQLKSDMTILVAGVTPNAKCIDQKILHSSGHIQVNKFLQVTNYKNVFALGDVVTSDNVRFPKLAQVATNQADIVAMNINNITKHKSLVPFDLHLKGLLISLGRNKGAGDIFGITVTGFIAWFIWRTVYLFKTPGIANKLKVAFSWTLHLFTKRSLVED